MIKHRQIQASGFVLGLRTQGGRRQRDTVVFADGERVGRLEVFEEPASAATEAMAPLKER